MPNTGITSDLNVEIDILGQSPSLQIYTQICLCYPIVDETLSPAVVKTLENGLARLYKSFPWLAGQVINEGAREGSTGIFKIVSSDETPRLLVKDLRRDASMPTMNAMRQAKFPASMLDESPICARRTLPGNPDEADLKTTPVFLVQVNFIIGGLLLTFVGQHNSMDMTGQAQVIDLFHKACHNEDFTDEDLTVGNLARRDLVSFFDDLWKVGSELDSQIIKPRIPPSPPPSTANKSVESPPPQSSWAFFSFPSSSLAALKSKATQSLPDKTPFISTDDTLTAFIWQSIMQARSCHLKPDTKATIARAIDVRKFMNVPATYPGLFQNMTYTAFPLSELINSPIGTIASSLRSSLDPEEIVYRTRALATFMRREPDKMLVNFTATLDTSIDLMLSSWAKVGCYHLDFNMGLGLPESVRRPKFAPFESLLYLMPKAKDGEITAMICLNDEDMVRLRADEEFAKFGEYVG